MGMAYSCHVAKKKKTKHCFSMFYTLRKHVFLTNKSARVLSILLYYKRTNDFFTIFRRFLKILPKLSFGQTIASERSREFPKITEDFLGRTDEVLPVIIQ